MLSPVLAHTFCVQVKAAYEGVFHINALLQTSQPSPVRNHTPTDHHHVLVELTFVCQRQCGVEILFLHGPGSVIDLV